METELTVDQIFSDLASHMIQGMMVHEQLMNLYLYLGLRGYAKEQEYHYISETEGYIRLCGYLIEHHDSLVKPGHPTDPAVIPDLWYNGKRQGISPQNRTQAIYYAMESWINWEKDTKFLYESAYKDLLSIHEVAAAEFIKDYILDVEEELTGIKTNKLHKDSMDFDIVSILEEQNKYEKTFRKELKKVYGGKE